MRPFRLSQWPAPCLALTLAIAVAAVPTINAQVSSAASEPSSMGQPLHISGSLVDTNGQPIAGASVELHTPPTPWEAATATWTSTAFTPILSVRTDAAGGFLVKAPGPGFYDLHFHAKGLASAQWSSMAPLLEEVHLLPVQLDPPRSLSVKVQNTVGEPISQVRLIAFTKGSSTAFGRQGQRSSTTYFSQRDRAKENGTTTFTISRNGGSVRASAPGFMPTTMEFDAGKTAVSATLTLQPATMATLRIKDPDGTASAGAVVMIGRAVIAAANADGLAQVPVTDTGERSSILTVHGAESLTGTTLDATALKSGVARPVELLPPKMLPGRVINKDSSAAVANAWVWSNASHAAQSAQDGSYQLAGPAYDQGDGTTVLRAKALGHFQSSATLRSHHVAQKQAPTLALTPAGSVRGIVRDRSGRPIAGVKISSTVKDITAFASRSGGNPILSALSQIDGSFSLDPVLSNTALGLTAEHPDFARTELSIDGLAPGSRRELTITMLTGARAIGRIQDEAGVAIAGATVSLTETVNTQDMTALITQRLGGGQQASEAISDGNGDFRFESLGAGKYDLEIKAPTYAPAKVQAVAVPSAQELLAQSDNSAAATGEPVAPPFELGTITLSPGAVIEGVVRSKSGRTLEGAEVTIAESGNTMMMVATMVDGGSEPDQLSDADGRFLFDSLAPNTPHKIDVEMEGYAGTTISNIKAPVDEPLLIHLEPASTLKGVVTDQLGAPLSNANLTVNVQMGSVAGGMMNFNARRMFKRATTDEDGRFEVKGLSAGKWDLVASAETYIDEQRKDIAIEAGVDPAELRIVLTKGATLSGTVVSTNGKPLSGVTVQRVVNQRSMFDMTRANRRTARTDGDGNYTMNGLPLGKGSFSAKHETHQEALLDAEIQEGDNQLNFTLERGLTISGSVVDPTGLPVAGARVIATKPGAGIAVVMATGGGAKPAMSDDEGNFTLEGLVSGSYALAATKDGYAEGKTSEPVRLDGNDEQGVLIRLATGAAITGIVEGLSYDELAQVQIMVLQPGGGTMPLMASVNYEGEYRLDNVAAGDWMVMATVGQGKSERQTITIEPGQQEMVVDFQFGGGLTLSGRVTRNGQPESGTMVMASGTSSSGSGQAQTGPDGEYVIEGLEPGGYQLVVSNFTKSPHQEAIELQADLNHDIDIRDAVVSGRVIDEDSGQPIEGADLTLTRTDDDSGTLAAMSIPGMGGAPRTDANGSFVIEGVVAGSYRVSAAREGYGATSVAIVVQGDNVSGIEIAMTRSVSLTVYVYTSVGTPARQVSFAVLDAANQPVLSQTRSLSEGGRLDIKEIPDGTWQLLVAENSGGATARQTVTVPGEPVQVRIPPAGGVRLLVPELADAQLTARVSLFDANGQRYQATGLQGVLAGVNGMVLDGRAMINAVPVGVWTAKVTTMDGAREWEAIVRVVEGTVTEYLVQ